MRLLCLNGWGGRLHEALIPFVAAEDPDILCLQEVVHSPASDEDWLTYRDDERVLPQRANFFRDIRHALPQHTAIFCPAAQGVLWDGDRAVPSQWGLASFVRPSLPVIAQAQGFVHKTYAPHGYGDHPRSRSAHALRLYDYGRDRPVSVVNVHGLRDARGKMDTPERAAQARRILDLSAQVSEPGDLRIICGDFNVEPDSETLALFGEHGFAELVTRSGCQSTRTRYYEKPGRFADYLLISDPGAVTRFAVVETPEVSDHRPLVLEI